MNLAIAEGMDRSTSARQSEFSSTHMSATGVYLLFAPEERPTRDAILSFVNNRPSVVVSHDPAEATESRWSGESEFVKSSSDESADDGWLELLRDGLTFDLLGLAPGKASALPNVLNFFDFPEGALSENFEAIMVSPGPHLAGGENSLPVVRGLMALVCDFLQGFDEIAGVIWPPSMSVIGPRYFESTTSAWLDGGAFPALGLTAFSETMDGGIQSVGLAYFIGRELRIEPPLSHDKVAATRLGIRLVNQLILMGGIESEEQVIAPDGGQLILRLSDNKRFIRVWAD